MSSKLGVENIAHTNGTNAMTISSGGVTAFTTDPFNSVIETWYYNDDTTTAHANDDLLNQGYSRVTTNATANKNGGMTHSTSAGTAGNGIWTFPSTGIWRIELILNFYFSGGAGVATGVKMQVTTNNSAYNDVVGGRLSGYTTNANATISLPYTLNVTDVANVKFRHVINTTGNNIIIRGGGTAVSIYTSLIHFIKLCPSV
tara:strand:- start:1272 stop:1874 length:603 start_codon:yes stop_codon:yes gene_type:complete